MYVSEAMHIRKSKGGLANISNQVNDSLIICQYISGIYTSWHGIPNP